MVVGQRKGERSAKSQICRKKSRIVAVIIRHLSAYIGNVPSPRPLTLITAYHRICGVVARIYRPKKADAPVDRSPEYDDENPRSEYMYLSTTPIENFSDSLRE